MPSPGLGAHEQVPGCPGYVASTAAERSISFGYTEHHVSECLGHSDEIHGVTRFLRSVFHRSCVTSPHVVAIGFASEPAPWGVRVALEVAVDFDAGAEQVARWPPPNYPDVSASWSGVELPESPTPPSGWPSGPVVGLSFAWRWQDDTQMTNATLKDSSGVTVPSVFFDPGEEVYLPSFFLYAHDPLAPDTYEVRYEGIRDGQPLLETWNFTVQ